MVKPLLPFQVSSKYPLSTALRDALGSSRKSISKRLGVTRVNVVSPGLCDDILEYIGPSLVRHKGCTIIDINPGCGLWSSKIHEFLKPRTHVLLEQRLSDRSIRPFLEPLLSQSSSYRYSTYDSQQQGLFIDDLWNLIEEKKLLLNPQNVNFDSSRSNQVNDSFLFLVNMSFTLRDDENLRRSNNLAERFMYQFGRQLMARSGFHSNGLVRMLLWVDDREKHFIMPRSVPYRTADALLREEIYNLTEIASSDKNLMRNRRPLSKDMRSTFDTAVRMLEAGIHLPPHRRSSLHQAAFKAATSTSVTPLPRTGTSEDPNLISSSWYSSLLELEDLEKRYVSGQLRRYCDPSVIAKSRRSLVETIEYKRMMHLQGLFNDFVPSKWPMWSSHYTDALISAELQINELERQVAIEKLEGQPTESTEQALRSTSQQRHEMLKAGFPSMITKALITADNIEAFQRHLLSWDNRTFEPLLTTPDDFWPQFPLALYDVQPSTSAISETSFNDPFISALTASGSDSLDVALNRIGPGTLEAVLGDDPIHNGKCPSLFDPLKGGRLNLENLRVQMLTREMIVELADAFHASPFLENHPLRRRSLVSSNN